MIHHLFSVDESWLVFAVRTYFMIASLSVFVAHAAGDRLKPLLIYGKTQHLEKKEEQRPMGRYGSVIDRLSTYSVPRSYFKHFYILSTCLGVKMIWSLYKDTGTGRSRLPLPVLLLSHSARRLYESCFVERPSGSRMWVGHYIIGITFYTFLNIAVATANDPWTEAISPSRAVTLYGWRTLAVACFFLAQVAQHLTHKQLAKVRSQCQVGQYVNITSGLFSICITPHYTSEIVLYFALACVSLKDVNMWLIVIWTTVVLSASAVQTNRWGSRVFQDWGHRWIILPGIL